MDSSVSLQGVTCTCKHVYPVKHFLVLFHSCMPPLCGYSFKSNKLFICTNCGNFRNLNDLHQHCVINFYEPIICLIFMVKEVKISICQSVHA